MTKQALLYNVSSRSKQLSTRGQPTMGAILKTYRLEPLLKKRRQISRIFLC